MRALPLLLAVLLAPAAAGCSLTSDPPGPGLYWVHDATGRLLHTVEVEDRDLGGDCSLANAMGLTARHFVWHDRGAAYRLDLATGEVLRLELPPRTALAAFTDHRAVDGGFLAHTSTFADNASRATWTLHRLDGTSMPLPLPQLWAYLVWDDGANALVQNRTAARAPVTTRLFDLTTGAVVAGPFPVGTLAAGPDWHVWHDNGTYLRVQDGQSPTPIDPSTVGYGTRFDGEGSWSTPRDGDGQRLLRLDRTGAVVANVSVNGSLVAASATHAVVGDYSPFGPGPEPFTIPAPAALLPLAAALLLRRRR